MEAPSERQEEVPSSFFVCASLLLHAEQSRARFFFMYVRCLVASLQRNQVALSFFPSLLSLPHLPCHCIALPLSHLLSPSLARSALSRLISGESKGRFLQINAIRTSLASLDVSFASASGSLGTRTFLLLFSSLPSSAPLPRFCSFHTRNRVSP